MEQRARFVAAAMAAGANIRALCRDYGISPTTGYKWLGRVAAGDGLGERSRRPLRSPAQMPAAIEAAVLAIRAAPNELWQIDFKGHFAVGAGRCHPLTLVDDHSRYAVVLAACADEGRAGVQAALGAAFARYGLPEAILMDNGPPWGTDGRHRHTRLTAWLMRLGIAPCHGRPFHPQTRGKNERFNGTLKREVIAGHRFDDLAAVQRRFDHWRDIYNNVRPHQAIGDEPPASRFRVSPRPFPPALPDIVYPPDCLVRRVQQDGRISFMTRDVFISQAFAGLPIGLRASPQDGVFDIVFCRFKVGRLDLVREDKADE